MPAGLLRDVAGAGRPRLVAYPGLRTGASRRPWPGPLFGPIAAADFAAYGRLLRTAGLPAGPEHARTLILTLHGALPHPWPGPPARRPPPGRRT